MLTAETAEAIVRKNSRTGAEKMKSPYTGVKRIFKAFTYSRDGFAASFKSEAAFRQDLCVFVIFTILALCLDFALWEKAVLISSLLLILLAELVNTAVETVVDRISPEYHKLSKKAKDIGSLVVLLSFVNAILLWSAFLYPKFF